MKLFHNSQDKSYRDPFGAVPTGTEVTLSLRVEAEQPPQRVVVRVFSKGEESHQEMGGVAERQGVWIYTVTIQVGDMPQLIWYDFVVTGHGETLYYANNEKRLGGVGQTTTENAQNSYQITVYDKKYQTPDWFREGIMYQVFPDRFYRSGQSCCEVVKKSEYLFHEDWYAPLDFNKHPYENGPANNDFYGGNLKGIEEKLPYLASLGVKILYLNPIFEAYSNHRYDTGNYKAIDPILGDEEDFSRLCEKGEMYGIRVILDGVFSHTGSDSLYFNKYGTYGAGQGAYQDQASPYRSWYQFGDYPNYESWWGCSNLPNVNEMEPSYLDYMLKDEDAVIKKWLRKGAWGWRLDVADELPDAFIALLRAEVKKTNPDSVVIGEVWEDASNKLAYGKQREYLLGHELDSVMNYPFRDQVIGFLLGYYEAEELGERVLAQMENYPKQTLYALMNIIGTHDTIRIKSRLGGMQEDCGATRLTSSAEELAIGRLKLASLMQMTFYGVPCIYYGDEIGMEGGKDPYNRSTYPWRSIDEDLRSWYQKLGQLRNGVACLHRGWFQPVYAKGDVYGYIRYFKHGKDPFGKQGDDSFALCIINRGKSEQTIELPLPLEIEALREHLSDEEIMVRDGRVCVTVPGHSGGLYLKKEEEKC